MQLPLSQQLFKTVVGNQWFPQIIGSNKKYFPKGKKVFVIDIGWWREEGEKGRKARGEEWGPKKRF